MGGGGSLARRPANALHSTADSLSDGEVGGSGYSLSFYRRSKPKMYISTQPKSNLTTDKPLKAHDQTFKGPQILILTYMVTPKKPSHLNSSSNPSILLKDDPPAKIALRTQKKGDLTGERRCVRASTLPPKNPKDGLQVYALTFADERQKNGLFNNIAMPFQYERQRKQTSKPMKI